MNSLRVMTQCWLLFHFFSALLYALESVEFHVVQDVHTRVFSEKMCESQTESMGLISYFA